LVLPDFEEMCRAYLFHRDEEEHQYADFLVIEIIDQTVRKYPGGELGKLYSKYLRNPSKYQSMIDFLRHRNGETFGYGQEAYVDFGKSHQSLTTLPSMRKTLSMLRSTLNEIRFQVGIRLLPRSFIKQNVSFANIGEKHHWLWDYHQLSTVLNLNGFDNVGRYSHLTSQFIGFPFHPLDVHPDGKPRKGAESMYIEAVKAY